MTFWTKSRPQPQLVSILPLPLPGQACLLSLKNTSPKHCHSRLGLFLLSTNHNMLSICGSLRTHKLTSQGLLAVGKRPLLSEVCVRSSCEEAPCQAVLSALPVFLNYAPIPTPHSGNRKCFQIVVKNKDI